MIRVVRDEDGGLTMAIPETLRALTEARLEEWFLEAIETEPLAVDDLLGVLDHLGKTNRQELADSWAEMLQDVLAQGADDRPVLRLLQLRHTWHGREAGFRERCRAAAKAGFSSRLGKAFVNALGDDAGMPPAEWLRRLELLFALAPGVLCYDRTWGFGVVARLDAFYAKVTVDFTRKRGHAMTFGYASEALKLIDETHLLARRHRDPEALQSLVRDNPAEVVRIALRSYGPLTMQQLKEALVDDVIPESAWKRFWDEARPVLQSDPLVDIPARRNDSISLLATARSHDDDWFAGLLETRDFSAIFEAIDELESARDVGLLPEALRAAVADRLAFVIWGAEGKQPGVVVRALLTARRLGLFDAEGRLGPRRVTSGATIDSLIAPGAFLEVIESTPARLLNPFLQAVMDHDSQTGIRVMLETLSGMTYGTLAAVIAFLKAHGGGGDVGEAMAAQFRAQGGSVAQILWLLKGPDRELADGVAGRGAIMMQAVERLEGTENGEHLRTQNQLRTLFEDGAWMAKALAELDPDQREMLLQRVRFSRGWDEIGRRTVIAGMVKAFPELEQILIDKRGAKAPAQGRARMTSWRSYRARQQQLKALVEDEIPANAREIAVARSYGDLRENAEYKYAKEQQRILYRRRDEIEGDLALVKGTDFSNIDPTRAGMGTCVVIRRPSGAEDRYVILGEWDRDEALNIISNRSKIAERLEGHVAGDSVELPASLGDETCQVLSVEALTDNVLEWLKADQES
jgi:transcription elongation GreA/GreB family factor